MNDTTENTTKIQDSLWLIVFALLTIVMLIWYIGRPLPADLADFIELVMFVSIAGLVTISFAIVAKQFEFLSTRQGLSMTLIAFGFVLWTAAEGTWFIYYLIDQDPFPSIADLFWIVGYIAFIAAISINARTIRMKFNRQMLATWIVISSIIAVVVIGFDVIPLLAVDVSIETLITIVYPIEDILVIIPALVILLKFKSGEVAKPWGILILGFILTAVGDILYAFAENIGVYSSPYSPVDLFLMLGYVACLASALLFIHLYRK